MKSKRSAILFLLLTLSTSAYSMAKLPFFKQQSVKERMENINQTIKELTPYIVSEKDFTDEKNNKLISKKLDVLTKDFENLKHNTGIESMGVSLNQSVIVEELKQTQNLFTTQKKSLARSKFTALLNLCINCHVQLDGQHTEVKSLAYTQENVANLNINDFQKAEMNFISRNYDEAISLYDKIILTNKIHNDEEQLYQSLGRELLYFIRIKKDFKLARNHFKNFLDKKVLPEGIEQEVRDWVSALSKKPLWPGFNPVATTEVEMDKFMNTFINDEDEGPFFTVDSSSEVLDLNLSQILLDYYNAHPETKLGGKILYWLGIMDKRLNNELFFSLSEYYLLTCMEKYPKEKISQDCFDSYLQELELTYYTKENSNFPKDVDDRILRLKKLIDYKESEDN